MSARSVTLKIRKYDGTFASKTVSTDAEELDLGQGNFDDIPETIALCTNLRNLNVSSNLLKSLPPNSIGSFTTLQQLDVSSNLIKSLPDWIGSLSNLTHLSISSNKLTSLPDSIGSLSNLTHLDISYNQFTSLPDWIGSFTNLTHLDISSIQLTSTIPNSIGSLSNLTHLKISFNFLTSLPGSIGSLSNLTSLDVSSNKFISLPGSIGSLSNLTYLNALSNQLTSIPDSIGSLSNLNYLDISFNQLISIPDSIASLAELQHLDISSNQLISIPDSITSLTKLQLLNISTNQLISIPNLIGSLAKLQLLNISTNQLKSLPGSIGFLSNLISLSISSNQLTSLPDSIGSLSNLAYLDVSSNQLTELPDSIESLSNLTYLDVSSNQLTELPDSIGFLFDVKFVIICHNNLTTLPDSIGFLSNLIHLDISYNQLISLPDSIGSLSDVKFVNISSNNLKSLPLGCASLIERLTDQFNYLNNPLSDIPEQYRHVHEHLVNYLRSSPKKVHRVKIMLTGEPSTGKTTFLNRMGDLHRIESAASQFSGSFRSEKTMSRQASTKSVEIVEWEADSRSLSFVAFDFPGQDLFHVTHQFFHTASNTIFLLFFDLEAEWKAMGSQSSTQSTSLDRLEFWWSSIHARAPGSLICIVGTKVDWIPLENREQLLEACSNRITSMFEKWKSSHLHFNPDGLASDGLRSLCPKKLSFWPISSISNEGIPIFLDFIKNEARRITPAQSFPDSVLQLKLTIRKLSADQALPAICIEDLLRKSKSDFKSRNQLITALKVLRDWGSLMWYGDEEDQGEDLSEWVILDPKWMADMIFKLVNEFKHLQQPPRESKFDQEELKRCSLILELKQPVSFFVKLLRIFHILIDDLMSAIWSPRRYLLPVLLPDKCSDEPLAIAHETLKEFCMERRYMVKFVPHEMIGRFISGLVSRLNTEFSTADMISAAIWRNGIIVNRKQMSVLVELMDGTLMTQTDAHQSTIYNNSYIRLSVRSKKYEVKEKPDEESNKKYKEKPEEQYRRMMTWLHKSLTGLIKQAYPGLMHRISRDANGFEVSRVPIVIGCPECIKCQQNTPERTIGWFEYDWCWSQIFQIKNSPCESDIRSRRIPCPVCSKQCNKRTLIPEFREVQISRDEQQQRVVHIPTDGEIKRLVQEAQSSSNKEESKAALHKLWNIFTSKSCPSSIRIQMMELGFVGVAQKIMKESTQDDNWARLDHIVPQVGRYDFEFPGTHLGEGGFGAVFQAKLHGEDVAMKMIPISQEQPVHRIQRELLVMCMINELKDPNLLPIKGWRVTARQKNCLIFMSRAESDLSQFLKIAEAQGDNPPGSRLAMALQIGKGVRRLHQIGIVHRDLKPQNILVFQGDMLQKELKLCDFGVSRPAGSRLCETEISSTFESNQTEITRNQYTCMWTAPEIVRAGSDSSGERISDMKSDIFSLGYLISFLCNATDPHPLELSLAALEALKKDDERLVPALASLQKEPVELATLISRCLAINPEERPSIVEVCVLLEHLLRTKRGYL